MKLPKYSAPAGLYSLPLMPPFYFENMTTRVFPLRASLASLQNFVDRYLNILPPEIGRFRTSMPYACLMMMDYGRLAEQATNLGWLAQREIMFAVPVEWHRWVDDRWVFQDWAFATPFIFVDSNLSLTLGRQVYGWPKHLGQMTPTLTEWMRDPRAPVRAATMSLPVFRELHTGKRQEMNVVLQIQREAPASPFQVPLDPRSPFAPWTAMSNAAAAMAGFAGDCWSMFAGQGSVPMQERSGPEDALRMAALLARMANPYEPDLRFDTLNLKQFRDEGSPRSYCYQAVTSAAMRVTSFNGGGLLGDLSALAGDTAGGYSIHLYDWPSLPIIETLGLQVTRRWRGDGVDVAEIKPLLPFWYDVDMIYERGNNVAWRSFDRVWHDPQGVTYPPAESDQRAERLYNSTLGAAAQTVAGPFDFQNSTLRVLPLLAKKKQLQSFLDRYLNEALVAVGERFELWGAGADSDPYAYVYLVATSYGNVSSGTDDIGSWATEEVTFFVPVKWYGEDRERPAGQRYVLRGLGVVPAFTYAGDITSAIAATEVLGIPTTKATFVSPPSVWMSDPSPGAHQPLLSVTAEVLSVLGQGQAASDRVILQILEGEMVDASPRRIAEQWGSMLSQELTRKQQTKEKDEGNLRNGRALALEVLANAVPYNVFTLKQFRDVNEPEDACYQSIVRIPRRIDQVYDLREITDPLHVRIKEYPSQPIVELLGLAATLADDKDGGAVYLLRPVRPFWLRMAWREDLGQRMWYRCGQQQWQPEPEHPGEPRWQPYFAQPGSTELPVGGGLADLVDDGDPRHLQSLLREWSELKADSTQRMAVADAVRAVEAIDPQLIIETILAREWENGSPEARWRQAWKDLNRKRLRLVGGESSQRRRFAELQFFTDELEKLRHQRYVPLAVDDVKPKLELLAILIKARAMIDNAVSGPAEADSAKLEFRSGLLLIADTVQGKAPAAESALPQPRGRLSERRDKRHLAKLMATLEALGAWPNPDEFWDHCKSDRARLLRVVELVRSEYKSRRAAVLDKMSKAAQAPDFCVPRSALGDDSSNDKDRLFPKHYCWKQWYVGPDKKED